MLFFSKKDTGKTFIVDHSPIFAELNPFEKNMVMQRGKVVEYKRGDCIYSQGDKPSAFFCIISGRVRAFVGKGKDEETLEYLNCGKYFGIISLLTGDTHSVGAEAVNDSAILTIDKEDFEDILNKIPKLAIHLSKTLSRRLRKRTIGPKKVFESTIVSIFGATSGVGRTTYAANLAQSLRKETKKEVILLNLSQTDGKFFKNLGIEDGGGPVMLKKVLSDITSTEDNIVNDPVSGADLLCVRYSLADDKNPLRVSPLLTYLTDEYHFIVVDMPAESDEVVLDALTQSDTVHLLTDKDAGHLKDISVLISELTKSVELPGEEIKVVMTERGKPQEVSHEEVYAILKHPVHATLPDLEESGAIAKDIARRVLSEPDSKYAKAVRRIARELGDVLVGLALGAGAAFGLSHIGVIKVLEREKIPIDMVVGTSMGGLIAALWASGKNGDEIERIVVDVLRTKRKAYYLLMDTTFPKRSFAKGRRIRKFLMKHIGKKTFQDIQFPFKLIACNMDRAEEVVLSQGSLVDAVMASIAIPGIFEPTKLNGDTIIDGGILAPVPTGELVRMGIKKIIAVNVLPNQEDVVQKYHLRKERLKQEMLQVEQKTGIAKVLSQVRLSLKKYFDPNILDILVTSMQTMESAIAEGDSRKADVLINPIALDSDWFDFFNVESLIKKGEEEATRSLEALKDIVEE